MEKKNIRFYESKKNNVVLAYTVGTVGSANALGVVSQTATNGGASVVPSRFALTSTQAGSPSFLPLDHERTSVRVDDVVVPEWGVGTNLYPQEVDEAIRGNKLLPSVLQKRVEFLYGKGLCLKLNGEKITGSAGVSPAQTPPSQYPVEGIHRGQRRAAKQAAQEAFDISKNRNNDISNGRNNDISTYRNIEDYRNIAAIFRWLDLWEVRGLPSPDEYVRSLIYDYYRFQTCVSQYHTNAKRTEIWGLRAIPATDARLGARQWKGVKAPRKTDCDVVLIGDWWQPIAGSLSIFPRFSAAHPFVPGAVQFLTDCTRPGATYAYNTWYDGLQDWIKASNLTPKYLSDYLKNALNAHVHCEIPAAWYDAQKQILTNICQGNINTDDPDQRIREYRGIRLTDDGGNPYAFNESMMQDLIAYELEKITDTMSGEGKGQGKLYATMKVNGEGWTFTDFPGKYKEYFDAVLSYDKRADQVTLAGVGISSSITNVEQDGQISKSGSDVYYNYLIYLNSLSYAENMVCRELNRALALNFPAQYEAGIRFGLDIQVPKRQQDTTASERLENQTPV